MKSYGKTSERSEQGYKSYGKTSERSEQGYRYCDKPSAAGYIIESQFRIVK